MKPANVLATVLACLSLPHALSAQSFQFLDFANIAGLTLNGAAVQSTNRLHISNNGSAQTGSAWYTMPVSVTEGFDTRFEFLLTTTVEGLAFVIHDAPTGATTLGGSLWGLGYGFGNSSTPIPRSLAIEMDCIQQGFLTDTSANEISVHTVGALGNSENEGASIARLTPVINLKVGSHTMRVNYQPGTLKIYVDNLNVPLITTNFSFETGGTQLSGGGTGGLGFSSNLGRVGFTSTTSSGSTNQRAEVRSWTWVSEFAPDPCYIGNAGITAGGPYDLFTISGSAGGFYRKVRLAIGDPFSLSLAPPPGVVSAPFVLSLTIGIATAATVVPTPWGNACFPPGLVLDLGSSFAPHTVAVPPGLILTLPFTLQAIMATDPMNPSLIELTNAVALEFLAGLPPTVTSVTPSSAQVGGTITIAGSNFSPWNSTLTISGNPVATTTIATGQITFAMPAGVPCGATLTVRHPDGASASIAFNPTPVITNQITMSGPAAGGNSIIVIGTGFAPGGTMTVGGNPAIITTASATVLIATAPPGTPGLTSIVITTPGGCSVSGNYTYL